MTTNHERVWVERPEAQAAWIALVTAMKSRMDERRYELATLAAARRLHSSYCCLAHGTILRDKFGEPVREIALDHRTAGLSDVDVAVMDFAEKVVDDASSIDEDDRQHLRDLGLSDSDILDVAVAAAARCFYSKTIDAMGAQPDAQYNDLEPELREALVVGRPIAEK